MTKGGLLSICIACMALFLSNVVLGFAQDFTVTRVSYSMRDSNVVVHYDLAGPDDKPYEVQLVLKRQTQPFFKMMPIDVSGDVGTDVHPGQNKTIVWHIYKDVPYGLDGDDFYFEVSVTRLGEKKSGSSWLLYVGGAIIGGAAAVYFGTDLFHKPGGSSIPSPPSRPQ